jgi:hypothetical protein
MAVQIRHSYRLEAPTPDQSGSRHDADIASWRRSRSTDLPSGAELDRQVEWRLFGRLAGRNVPPFSTEDWTAVALAELVARETGWWFDVTERDGTWEAMWIEHPPLSIQSTSRRRILSLVTATAPTRALAICRSLLRAAGCPRWPGRVVDASGGRPARG